MACMYTYWPCGRCFVVVVVVVVELLPVLFVAIVVTELHVKRVLCHMLHGQNN